MGERWKKFREFDSKGILFDRVEGHFAYTKRGYVVNRRIFQIYFLFMLCLIVYVGVVSKVGWREMYIHCPEDAFSPCENPTYNNCNNEICKSIESEKYLQPGFSIGTPPDPQFMKRLNGLWLSAFFGIIVTFLINHRLYNKNRSFETILPESGVDYEKRN